MDRRVLSVARNDAAFRPDLRMTAQSGRFKDATLRLSYSYPPLRWRKLKQTHLRRMRLFTQSGHQRAATDFTVAIANLMDRLLLFRVFLRSSYRRPYSEPPWRAGCVVVGEIKVQLGMKIAMATATRPSPSSTECSRRLSVATSPCSSHDPCVSRTLATNCLLSL
jgi:hypothetical protein